MVRYYGYYSNKSRGLRTKAGKDSEVAALIDSDVSRKAFRKNWARLIQKIYHVDPLICPKCQGKMRIISWIEDKVVNELPRGKPRSIGAKTTGVARNEAGNSLPTSSENTTFRYLAGHAIWYSKTETLWLL